MKKGKFLFLVFIFVILISCNIKGTNYEDENIENPLTTKESEFFEVSEKSTSNIIEETIETSVDSIKNQTYEVGPESLKENLVNICKTPRHYLSDKKEDSVQYILNKLTEYGYAPVIQEFPIYERDLTLNFTDTIFHTNPMNSDVLGTGKNIIVSHNDNKNGKKTLYITAHYDTTRHTQGVIDNGTGTAIVLELAKIFRDYDSDLNLIFVLLDAEEKLLQGSVVFANNLNAFEKENALGCINIDMVGEIGAGEIVMKFGTSEHNIISLLWNEVQDQDIKIYGGVDTDEYPFYRAKIPAVTIADELSNFSLAGESAQIQLEHIDFTEIANVTKQICKFIEEFKPEYYSDLLSNRVTLESNIDASNAYEITNASFEKMNAKLIDNGFICETQYHYIYTTDERFSVNIIPGVFYENDDFHDYNVVENTDASYNFYYKIAARNEEIVKVNFYNGAIFGTITSEYTQSEEIWDDITRSFIKSYNTVNFGQN